MRRVTGLVLIGAIAILAGCVGDTRQASDVRAHQAQLNAYGHTNTGPAYWWWEWGTTRKGVANGQGTKTPKQGPASSPNDVALKWLLTGLDNNQTYYFRACGQDQVAGSPANCGRIYDFGTGPGDSTVFSVYYGVRFFGAPDVAHNLTVSDGAGGPGHIRLQEDFDASTTPPTGSVLIPGDGCRASSSSSLRSFNDTADCTAPAHFLELDFAGDGADFVNQLGTSEISASLFGGDDYYSGYNGLDSASGMDGNDTLYGYDGADALWGDAGNDLIDGGPGSDIRLDGGPGNDTIYGQAGDDLIYDPEGNNTVDCGPGDDTYYTDTLAHFNQSTGCEHFVQANPATAAKSSAAAKAKFKLK
jgi:Ca2+-binding RTX toxin-like protein